jgi:hypothetical protein
VSETDDDTTVERNVSMTLRHPGALI